MKLLLLLSIILLNLVLIRSIELFVSSSLGTDVPNCGTSTLSQCKSVSFAVQEFKKTLGSDVYKETYPSLVLTIASGTYTQNESISIWKYDIVIRAGENQDVIFTGIDQSFFTIFSYDFSDQAHTYVTLSNINLKYSSILDSALLNFNSTDSLTLNIQDCLISSNTGKGNSVLSFQSPENYNQPIYSIISITITNSNFEKNIGEFGVMYSGLPTKLTIFNSTFTNNKVTARPNSDYSSGLFHFDTMSEMHIGNSNFYSNFGTPNGVFLTVDQNSTFITNSSFFNNEGTMSGVGGIYGGSLYIEQSVFHGNRGDIYGGVFVLNADSSQFHNTSFIANSAKINGGVMYTLGGEISFYQTTMKDNSVLGLGTTVYCAYNSSFSFEPNTNTFYQNLKYNKQQQAEGFDCNVNQLTQTCLFFGDVDITTTISNNYNCTNGPWVPVIDQHYVYGVPKGAFAAIALGLIFISVSTFFIIRYIIRKQMLHLQQFGNSRDAVMSQRLIN